MLSPARSPEPFAPDAQSPIKPRYEFHVQGRAFLAPDGQALTELPAWTADSDRLIDAYRAMALVRLFDQKAIALQRTGQLGTYPSVLGHEAIGAAMGQALEADDVFIPYYRDQVAQVLRGVSLTELLLYWGGDERGSAYADCPQDLPVCVPIATQCGHAAGIACSFRIRNERRVAICSLGDGATSKGDFLESLNLAGAWHLPLVFVVANNQWAISTPRSVQCGAETLAQKAVGAGVPGVIVDGNDYVATADAVRDAVERARQGKGATLIEAVTYRLGDHTTADDATRYRSSEELKRAWAGEPVKRLQGYLHQAGLWDAEREQALQRECKERIDDAVKLYLETPREPPEAMLEYLFEQVPKPRRAQWETLRRKPQAITKGGPDHG